MPHWTPQDLAAWSGGTWRPAPPAGEVTGVCHDTHALRPGDLFIALRGTRTDGHLFLADAFARGAAAALVARDEALPDPPPGPLLVVDQPLAALGRLAGAHRRTLAATTVIGVTGSAGKTTVKELLASMLQSAGSTARSRGNWNNDLGLPLSLLAVEPSHYAAVLEVGISHPGEMAPLAALLQPDWAVVTSVGPVHIAFFRNEAAIAHEKAELLRALSGRGAAVLDADSPWFEALRARAPGRVVTTSLGARPADYVARPEAAGFGAAWRVTETASGESFAFTPPLPGRHNAANALLAIAAARGLGLAWVQIAAGLTAFVPPPMRWEPLTLGGATVVNDAYNANPLSMAAALATFAESPARGGRWLALGDMLELGAQAEAAHRELGRRLAAGRWAGLIGVGPGGAGIAAGARDAGASFPVVACATAEDAGRELAARVRPGDAVLIKASRGARLERALDTWRATLRAANVGDEATCSTTCTP